MARIRRGNYVFQTWVGDHPPRHVHVYKDRRLILKWDLDRWRVIRGTVSVRILGLLLELVREGKL